MKYEEDERIEIGRQVFTRELTRKDALLKYEIGNTSLTHYINLYKESIEKHTNQKVDGIVNRIRNSPDIEAYEAMSKEELIDALILAKANELRAKKGYEVKGAGADKEYVSLSSKNSKS